MRILVFWDVALRSEFDRSRRFEKPYCLQLQGRLDTLEDEGVKVDSHIACRVHAVLLLCRAAKGLECVFPI